MNLAALSAIRAIVAVHATYNRDYLLTVIDADMDRLRTEEPNEEREAVLP